MKFQEYADRDMLMLSLASRMASEIDGALRQRDEVLVIVPGGTTPAPVFDSLSVAHLEWERVTFVLSDERWVDESSERSNTRLLRKHLLVDRSAAAKFIPFYKAGATPEEVFGELAEEIEQLLPASVALLGMGEDMHVASLFPDCPNLPAALRDEAPNVMVMRPPSQPEPRLSLSAAVLDGALAKHLVITGAAKRAALERAREIGDPLKAPVLSVLKGATVHWAP